MMFTPTIIFPSEEDLQPFDMDALLALEQQTTAELERLRIHPTTLRGIPLPRWLRGKRRAA